MSYDRDGFSTHLNAAAKKVIADNTILAAGGYLKQLAVFNPNTSKAFIQIYDESGDITVGTTTPKITLHVPHNDSTSDGVLLINFDIELGLPFGNTIKYACTTAAAGATAVTTGLIVNAIYHAGG